MSFRSTTSESDSRDGGQRRGRGQGQHRDRHYPHEPQSSRRHSYGTHSTRRHSYSPSERCYSYGNHSRERYSRRRHSNSPQPRNTHYRSYSAMDDSLGHYLPMDNYPRRYSYEQFPIGRQYSPVQYYHRRHSYSPSKPHIEHSYSSNEYPPRSHSLSPSLQKFRPPRKHSSDTVHCCSPIDNGHNVRYESSDAQNHEYSHKLNYHKSAPFNRKQPPSQYRRNYSDSGHDASSDKYSHKERHHSVSLNHKHVSSPKRQRGRHSTRHNDSSTPSRSSSSVRSRRITDSSSKSELYSGSCEHSPDGSTSDTARVTRSLRVYEPDLRGDGSKESKSQLQGVGTVNCRSCIGCEEMEIHVL